MTRAAIIPARGGSRRIPGKNIRPFFGRPIIEYSIETAARSGLFDHGIWVSTDEPSIAKVAWDAGAKVHPRQKALAEDDVGTQDVARSVARELWPVAGEMRPDMICVIYPCAPLMQTADLHRGLQALIDNPAPYAYATGPDLVDAGQWYFAVTGALLHGVDLHHPATVRVVIPRERVCDVNTIADWQQAELLYAAMLGRQ